MEGLCVAGPMAGLHVITRSDAGFIATDRAGSAAWLYYASADGRFVLDTRPDPSSLDEHGTRALDLDRALDAALIKGLDVIAVPAALDEDQPVADADAGPDPQPLVLTSDVDEGRD